MLYPGDWIQRMYYDSIPKNTKIVDVILRHKFLLWSLFQNEIQSIQFWANVGIIASLLDFSPAYFPTFHSLLTLPPEDKWDIRKGAMQISQFYSLLAALRRENEHEKKREGIKRLAGNRSWNECLKGSSEIISQNQLSCPSSEKQGLAYRAKPCTIWRMSWTI